jgi:hypothetical protein
MAVVQQVGFDGQVATTKTVTIASSTAGNTLLVFVVGNATPAGVPQDNLLDIWPVAAIGPISSNEFLTAYVLPGSLNPGGITSITINQPACAGWIVEESGLLSSPLDKVAGQSSGGTLVTSGNTATLSQANEVVYGLFGHGSHQFTAGAGYDASAFTNYGGPGAPYTPGNQGNNLAGGFCFIERQVVTATTALAATATIVSSTVDAAIVTLKQGGSGGTAPFTPFRQTQIFVTDIVVQM